MGLDSTVDPRPFPEGGQPRLIVCEHQRRWGAALRRELAGSGVSICRARSVGQCWDMLIRYPASFVVVELAQSQVEALLGHMVHLERDWPLARVAVVAQRSLSSHEWLMREAGAVHFVVSTRELAPLASMAVRHLATVPKPRLTLAEEIWSHLPWEEW